MNLSSLHIYPVKGLKGIDVSSARSTDRGLEHDRRWMLVDGENEFLTQREHPKMATVWTEIADGALHFSAPDMPPLQVPLAPPRARAQRVRVWRSVCDALPVSADADAWFGEYLGFASRLVYMPDETHRLSNPDYAGGDKLVSFADGYAYLLTNEASLADLNRRLEAKGARAVPMNRFRPNFVVRGAEAFVEDGWKEIRIGEAVFRAAKPCGRCQVTTTDQATGEVTGPEPLATLASFRDSREFGAMFGMNLVTVKTGTVRVGDAVELGT